MKSSAFTEMMLRRSRTEMQNGTSPAETLKIIRAMIDRQELADVKEPRLHPDKPNSIISDRQGG
jgi:hypothetical protein